MAHRKILTTRQEEAIFGLPRDRALLMQYYTLAIDDLKLIARKRRAHNKLGFALQLCALRYPGRLLEVGEFIPPQVLGYLAEQIDISPLELENYAIREETRREHLIEIRQVYGYKMYTRDIAKNMRSWVIQAGVHCSTAEQLLLRFVGECRDQKIILPRITTITRLCADAMVTIERDVEAQIANRLDQGDRANLDALILEQIDGRLSHFVWLRQFEVGGNSADINRLLDRLEFLQNMSLKADLFSDIPHHQVSRLQKMGESYFAHQLKDISDNRRLAILAVCAFEWQSEIADTIIETHDRICGRIWREAQRACDEKLEASKQAINQTLKGLRDIGNELVLAHSEKRDLNMAISWEAFEELVTTAGQLTSTTSADPTEYAAQGYHRFRRYAPRMIECLDIRAIPAAQDLLQALDQVRSGDLSDLGLRFLKRNSKWRKAIKMRRDDRLWEVAVLFEMREAFRARDLWLMGSKQYRETTQVLVPLPTVHTASKIAVPDDPHEWLDMQKENMTSDFKALDRAARKGQIPGGSIENGVLKIERPKPSVPEGADDLITDLYKRLPETRITDILLEVDQDIGFTDPFRSLQTGAPCKDKIGLMNVVLAEGINLGLRKMAEASNSHDYWQLMRIAAWHLDSAAIDAALSMVIEAQSNLPMAKFWGFGDTASSDGQFFPSARQGEAMNLINARYGNTPGLRAYSHVSDQFGPFAAQNIPATASEAPYILDGLLMNEAGRKIKDQYTDTGGVSDLIFAATHLLGYNFIPRIRDLPSRRLYAFEPSKLHHSIRPLVGGKIRQKLIVENWSDFLRFAATMSLGVQKPSTLIKALSAFPRQSELSFALREMGRVVRTRFIISWLLNPEMQARAQIGLNKGEAHHALKNAIRIGRQGEIRDRTAEAQHYRMAGLNLLTAIIIYWNTKQLGQAVQARKNEKLDCQPELLKHTSPLGWAHILLTGEYNWPKIP